MAAVLPTISRFGNLSASALADEIGRINSISKAAEAELSLLKAEFKTRGLTAAAGDAFSVTCTEQISGRLDIAKVREFLGDAASQFEVVVISNVVRIRPAARTLAIAA